MKCTFCNPIFIFFIKKCISSIFYAFYRFFYFTFEPSKDQIKNILIINPYIMKQFLQRSSLVFYLTIILGINTTLQAQVIIQEPASGIFQVPSGVTEITIEAWGGGGKGGDRTTRGSAGGGGGGGYSKSIIPVTPNQILEVIVGTGSTNNSLPGGDSSVRIPNSTYLVLAKGGNSVTSNNTTGVVGGNKNNGISIGAGDIRYSGGRGANSATNIGGGGGSSAGDASDGANGATPQGGTAPANGGNGGNGGSNTANGNNGLFPGGGGGGSSKNNNGNGNSNYGGNGANGRILISYKKRIEVSGNNIIISNNTMSPQEINNTFLGAVGINTPVSKTFVIKNTLSSGDLTIGNFSISGTNSADFSITELPSSSIGPNSSTTFTVTCIPSELGTRNAVVSFTNNDPADNVFRFAVQSQGNLANGPGGITDNKLQLWLRTDMINGTSLLPTDGTNVSTWKTIARGSDATKPTSVRAPKFRNNASYNINFNAVVDFTNNYNNQSQVYTDNDNTREYLKGTNGFYSHDMFVVMIPDVPITRASNNMDVFCGDRNQNVQETDVTGIGLGDYSSRFSNEILAYCIGANDRYGIAQVVNASTTISSAGIINTSQNSTNNGVNLLYNGNSVGNTTVNASSFENISNSRYWIGRSEGWNGSLDGRVAEIITFSNRLSDIERSNVQSYLAIKYGITLGQNGVASQYTNSNGTVIWNNILNSGFNFNIAGIGRDDASMLNQKQSKSINSDAVLTIGLGDIAATNSANSNSFTTDKSYLIWGSNGQSMDKSNQKIPVDLGPVTLTTFTDLINRKWKVQEIGGDVSTVKVAIPTAAFSSGFPTLNPNDAYVMIIANDANFTSGIEMVFLSPSGTNQVCEYDFDGTKYITFGVAHRQEQPLHITLDGVDDYVKIGNSINLTNAFTIMSWVRLNGNNNSNTERTIVAKQNATDGYRLLVQNDNKIRMEWLNNGILYSSISNTALPDGIWHNIAVTFGSGTIRFYIDGTLDKTETMGAQPTLNNSMFTIGGQYIDKEKINHLFKGDIDELRIWNMTLSINHIRFILNQEIELINSNSTTGKIIPYSVSRNDIATLAWNRLLAYYSMNSYIGTHLDDDSSNKNRGSLVVPDKIHIKQQSAPLPYISQNHGEWSEASTWQNNNIQDLPYSLSIVDGKEITWNIVKTNHNISSNGNKNLLAAIVSNNVLSIANNSKLEITHYLKLDGKIDLQERSQLLQPINSDLDPTSIGILERDQQGQSNKFNYNYWCSPVGNVNGTTNNNNYTVNSVLRDGTDPDHPKNITWTSSINGAPTSPITLSSYWIYKFQNLTPIYANWSAIGQNGTLTAGQGFTLKGSGAATTSQNLTFVGKPNNGPIRITVSPNNMNLTGNPYPSAIDAQRFINDNIDIITGSLYFWEHFPTNNTHNLAGYQGGYAVRNLTGGTAPVSPAGISGLGSSTRIPRRYIPVGQGFYVIGNEAGGEIKFDNAQRTFVKEDNGNSNIMFRTGNRPNHFFTNTDTPEEEIEYTKLRLGFNSYNGFHRQLLLGFMENNATENIDPGYDAIHLDDQQNDMYFMHNDTKLIIQGVGHFNPNQSYPIGIKTHAAGNIQIMMDNTENFDDSQDIFIYDKLTSVYHSIKNNVFNIQMPQGTFNDRFELRFINHTLGNHTFDDLATNVKVAYINNNNIISIINTSLDVTVEQVTLYNILGQSVATWNVENETQTNIVIPVASVSTGTYIVRVATSNGTISKKIIIK